MLRGNRWHGPVPMVDRFWSRVEKSDGCWLWTGKTGTGYPYGRISPDGGKRTIGAHVASWRIHFGAVPDSLWVCHTCDTPRCVRPDHLFLGTNVQNWQDMRAKERGSKPPLLQGDAHPSRRYPKRLRRGEANNKARLTAAQVRAIRALHQRGATIRGLARQYGLTKTAIANVVHYVTWRHVT